MFPVSVCLRIESKRFVEEETQRKRLASMLRLFRFVTPSEVKSSSSVVVRLLRGIPRLRFAPLGMTQLI